MKILQLVEGIAEEGETFFKRPVTIMSDFEDAFIGAVKDLYPSVTMKACFFHFTQLIRKKADRVIRMVTKAASQKSVAVRKAEKAKRRIMLLALLPEDLITPEVVELILADWKEGVPASLKDAFNNLAVKFIQTYTRKLQPDGQLPCPRFPPSLWSVGGRSVRTNNGAESVHSELNPKTKGRLTLHRFLAILEGQMAKARVRIASGCEPASRTSVPEKNYALVVEPDKLLCGDQGVLPFLDNCGSILSLDTVEEVQQFSPPEVDRESDTRWSRENRDAIVQATRNLYFRLHPGGQFSDEIILEDIIEWAFQVLPPAAVPKIDGEILNRPLFPMK